MNGPHADGNGGETSRFLRTRDSNFIAIVVAVGSILTTGAGGGAWLRAGTLDAKIDQMLSAQGEIRAELAAMKGAGTEGRVKELEDRQRRSDERLTGLEVRLAEALRNRREESK